MRLLYLNHNYRFGGTYYRAMPIAVELAKRGHNVTLMTVSPQQRWRTTYSQVDGVHLIETPNWGQDNSGEGYGPPDNLFRLVHALLNRYDIIHMFDHKPNATFSGMTGRLRGAKLVADWADWWGGPGGINDVTRRRVPAVGAFEAWWEERSKTWANGVVTISTVLRQRALDLGILSDRLLYLPTGAATDRIRPIALTEARQTLDIPLNWQMVGFIGMGQGDLEIVMNAIAPIPDLHLMVIGSKNPTVLALAKRLGVAHRLWQTGFVPDAEVSTYLACADLMVLPMADRAANRGRLPNKFLDYLCAGRPVVASPIGDIQTIIKQHGVGLLAHDREFGVEIARLLSDETLRRTMGDHARHIAETIFGWPRLIEQLEAFYHRILQQ